MNEIPDLPEIELSLDDLLLTPAPPAAANEVIPQKDPLEDVPLLTAEALPPNVRRYVDPASPGAVRSMAARGLVPLNPSDMVYCLSMLALDPDEKISQAAQKSMGALPDKILSVALRDESASPRVLDLLAKALSPDQADVEMLILNNAVHDSTLAHLAGATKTVKFLEIMAANQIRILRDQDLMRAILENPVLPSSTSDSVCDFAVRSGVILHDLPQFDAAYLRIFGRHVPGKGTAEEAQAKGETAEDIMREMASMGADALAAEASDAQSSPVKGAPKAKKSEETDASGRKKSLTQRVLEMNVSERIKLASRGSMEARTILLRDPNRMIQSAVINSPKITENEVLGLAQSKNTGDEILRTIMSKREWTRQYRVRMALIHNPKTPAQTAIRMLDTLRETDVKRLAKDKNVPAAVQQAAKKRSTPKEPPKKK